MPYICEYCHKSFELTYAYSLNRPAPRFCSQQCNGNSRRKPVEERVQKYELIWVEGRRVFLHRKIFIDAYGPGPHPCHWCGTPVQEMSGTGTAHGALIVDHLDNNQQNNAQENLVPSCHTCNCRRNDPRNVADDEVFITRPDGSRHRAEQRICEFCETPFLHIKAERNPRKGRFCSKDCMYLGWGLSR